MSKYRIGVIGVYFGKMPSFLPYWLKSCEYNSDIDFIVVTDQNIINTPKNVRIINLSFDEFKKLASEKLKMKVNLHMPYKCCDFRPAYGVIFEDFLNKYDFWGHCDFDVIFGDIRKFVTDEILELNDKVYTLGHLSLYKNNNECNKRFKLEGSICGNYKEVFLNSTNVAFDEELGIHKIYLKNGFPVYEKRDYADISKIYFRFKLARKDINYKNQVFYWENGHVYRAYEKNGKIISDEFVYIHFKERKFINSPVLNEKDNSFFITSYGFIIKNEGIPRLEDIQRLNPFISELHERFELNKFKISELYKRIINKIRKMKNEIKTIRD